MLLLDQNQMTKHVVAEVLVQGHWIIVDPAYRVVFRDASGNTVTREDLLNPAKFAAVISKIPKFPAELHLRQHRPRAHRQVAYSGDSFAGHPQSHRAGLGRFDDDDAAGRTRIFCGHWSAALLLVVFLLVLRYSLRWFGEARLGHSRRPVALPRFIGPACAFWIPRTEPCAESAAPSASSSREAGEAAVRRMIAAMVHRGPDEEGFLNARRSSLGSRRLSIIDLAGGSQPIWNETETLAVVFNGEIYNFRDLAPANSSRGPSFPHQLRHRSHRSRLRSSGAKLALDICTACLLSPWSRCRRAATDAATSRFPGARPPGHQTSLLRRDPDGVLFSPPKCARCWPAAMSPRHLAARSRLRLFAFRFGLRTPHPGRRRVLAASRIFDERFTSSNRVSAAAPETLLESAKINAESNQPESATASSAEAVAAAVEVRILLEEAVRSHLIADVPVGVFLSSGFDSTALAALASRAQERHPHLHRAFPGSRI